MSLEDLEKQIYSFQGKKKKPSSEERTSSPQASPERSRGWTQKEKKKEKNGRLAKRVAVISVSFAVLAVLLALVVFFSMQNGQGGEGVDISLHAPDEVYRGAPFEISVQISNDIDTFLKDATLTLTPSAGLVPLDGLGTKSVVTEEVGDIGGGSLTRKTFRFVARGLEQTVEKVAVELSYVSEGQNILRTEEIREVFVDDSAIKLKVEMPEQILQDSEFPFEITYENVSPFDFENLKIEVQYPPQFEFTGSNIPPNSLDNVWEFPTVEAGSKGGVQIEGILSQNESIPVGLRVEVLTSILGKQVSIAEAVQDFSLAPSPVRLRIFANNSTEHSPNIGESIQYTIEYENMSGIALADVVLTARFDGELFIPQSFNTNGNFNSVTNTVTWTTANIPAFRILEPGASGKVSVSVRLRPTFPISRTGDRNYSLSVTAKLDSPSVPYYLSSDSTTAVSSMISKVRGLALIDAKALFRDPSAEIVNSGSLPPRANEPTEYTVHWIVKNYSTDLSEVKISSFLESGVEWTGLVKSNTDSVPLYNERTQEVIWSLDKIPATQGVVGEPLEAIFQIRAIPNSSQVGRFQPLLKETRLSATDDFTGFSLSASDSALSTELRDDPTTLSSSGRVTQ